MSATKSPCRHHDIRIFDGLRCCLACGEAVLEDYSTPDIKPQQQENSRYRYRRLSYELGREIRLLVLYPAQEQDELTCDIIHVNLNDNPVYEALSYTWADETGCAALSQSIICSRDRATIAITKNCEAALRRLRMKGRKRMLWVDAICIDQDEIAEKNHQIQFMGVIYASASQVLAFKGCGSVATQKVMDYLNNVPNPTMWRDRRSQMSDIKEFIQGEYFQRVWVLQEIALAKLVTLFVGTKTVRWSREVVQCILSLLSTSSTPIPSALKWFPGQLLEEDLLEALNKSRVSHASDPRDKVYALLGLVKQNAINNFPVDYSMSIKEINISVAQYLIMEQHNMNVLKYTCFHAADQVEATQPSWVPEWQSFQEPVVLPTQFDPAEVLALSNAWYLPSDVLDASRLQDYTETIAQVALDVADDRLGHRKSRSTLELCSLIGNQHTPNDHSQPLSKHDLALYISSQWYYDFHFTIFQNHLTYVLRIRAHRLDRIVGIKSIPTIDDFTLRNNDTLPKAVNPEVRCKRCKSHGRNDSPTRECLQRLQATKEWFPEATFASESPLVTRRTNRTHATRVQLSKHESLRRALTYEGARVAFQTTQSFGSAHSNVEINQTVWALDGLDTPVILRHEGDHYYLVEHCHVFRATKSHQCGCCLADAEPWDMTTEIIDIW